MKIINIRFIIAESVTLGFLVLLLIVQITSTSFLASSPKNEGVEVEIPTAVAAIRGTDHLINSENVPRASQIYSEVSNQPPNTVQNPPAPQSAINPTPAPTAPAIVSTSPILLAESKDNEELEPAPFDDNKNQKNKNPHRKNRRSH